MAELVHDSIINTHGFDLPAISMLSHFLQDSHLIQLYLSIRHLRYSNWHGRPFCSSVCLPN